MKSFNDMNFIHDKKIKIRAECNLLHVILNYSKHTKNIKIRYYHILNGSMNTHREKAKFKNVRIILDSGCSSSILMIRLIMKLQTKKYDVIK